MSATEEAQLARRTLEISLRETERVLGEVRADAAKAAREASIGAAEADESLRAQRGEERGIETRAMDMAA